MITIKSFTSLEQSKKLAEILPIESADMYYQYVLPKSDKIRHNPEIGNPTNTLKWYNEGYVFSGKEPITMDEFCVPCWSLASLLGVLPEIQGSKPIIALDDNYITYPHMSDLHIKADNLVDACYELILKLNELNLL